MAAKQKRGIRALLLLVFTSSIITTILAVAAGEWWTRRNFPSFCSRRDALLRYVRQPNCSYETSTEEFSISYRFSSLGLRTREITRKKPSDISRVLMLGDSFTEGAGVEDDQTFSALVEQRLLESGTPAEVINAGVSGYSPLLSYLYLRNDGMTLSPDVVVLNLNVTDLLENEKFHLMAKTDNNGFITSLVTPGRHFLPETAQSFLWNHSRLYSYAQQKMIPKMLKMLWGIQQQLRDRSAPVDAAIDVSVPSSFTIHNPFTLSFDPSVRNRYERARSTIIADIETMLEDINLHGMKLLVVFQPHGYHVAPFEWAEGRTFYHLDPQSVVDDPLAEDLSQVLAQRNIPFLDLTPSFRVSSDPSAPLYFNRDGHWTVRGHRIAAEEIAKRLRPLLQKETIEE